MPKLIQAGLKTESPWVAGFAGVWFGLPSLYMIAAIAAVLDAGVGAEVQVVALIVFSLVAFIQTLVPLVGLLTAPGATRASLDRFYAWLKAHQRLAVTVLSTLTGTYLVIKGITRV
jgi:hypothetical protein